MKTLGHCGGQSRATTKGSLVSLPNVRVRGEKENGARMQGGGRPRLRGRRVILCKKKMEGGR